MHRTLYKASLDDTPSPAIRLLLPFVFTEAQDRPLSLTRPIFQAMQQPGAVVESG